METVRNDLSYGARLLGRNVGFTVVAVTTLALGIGANTAIFSVVNAVLLRPLPYKDPNRLVMVWETNLAGGHPHNLVSVANFIDWQEESHAFDDMAAFMYGFGLALTDGDEPLQVESATVTPNLFPLLGVEAAVGRTFLPDEGEPGNEEVVLLSHGLWQQRFGSDLGAVGKRVRLEGHDVTVVGVMPPTFHFPSKTTEVWIPLSFDADEGQNRKAHSLRVLARLKANVTLNQAQAEMGALARRLEQQYPEFMTGWGVNVVRLYEQVVGEIRPALVILLGAVGFLLLIACTNVANLLLVRAAHREREFAIRAALGAGRSRIVRQLLTESVLLSLAGGALALLLALWCVDILVAFAPEDVPRLEEVGLNWWVLGFTLMLSFLTGVVFGLVPALRASRPDLHESLKAGGRASAGGLGQHRIRSVLVVSEIALALVLLIGAGLMIRSFLRLQQVDPGFNPNNVLAVTLNLPSSRYREIHQQNTFYRDLLEGVATLPEVKSVAATSEPPIVGWTQTRSFIVEGRFLPGPGEKVAFPYRTVSPRYFRTMGIPLLRGRRFTEQDTLDVPPVLIVNEAMAQRVWPNEDPIGQRVSFSGPEGPWYEIVGVVGDIKDAGLDAESRPVFFAPYRQRTWRWMSWMTLMVRTDSNPLTVVPAVKAQIWALDKDLPILKLNTMKQVLSNSVAQRRFNMLLLVLFAVLALLLAAVGMYGVVAYAVSQRTPEIGVRMALGAQPRDIVRLVVGQGLILALIGVTVGVGIALALTQFLASLLYSVRPTDPVTFVSISALLTSVVLVACYLPARRAARVDPMVALHYE